MNLKSRSNLFTEQTAPKPRMLELKVDIELKLGARLDGNYESSNDLAKIRVEKNLVSTTDTKLKEIKAEIIASIESQFDEIEKVIDNSSRLSDGFWSKLKDEKDKPF